MRRLLVPVILPQACSWVARQERRILKAGLALTSQQLNDARALGVRDAEKVRVLHVQNVPLPCSWLARFARIFVGTSFRETSGLSARYGIFIRAHFAADRHLLAHELTHTHQYERLGGIRPFLQRYLHECLTVGYASADLEIEARDAANNLCAR